MQHTHTIDPWRHAHVFLGTDHPRNERRTWLVIALTGAMMAGEIAAGVAFGSMALLADGWHMATHAGALAISALAYRYARRHADDPRFAFETGKLGDLAGYTSAIVLALIALFIGWESLVRFTAPVPIRFGEAVAVLGLAVNLLSAWLLGGGHEHVHAHHDHHHHDHQHHGHGHREHAHGHHADHNLRSAYLQSWRTP